MRFLELLGEAAREPQRSYTKAILIPARAGFPSPADDFAEEGLDLNELMVAHKAATFFVRVRGTSMEGAGILNGDLLVVDRAVKPTNGKTVVAAIDGELVVKRFVRRRGKIVLEAASPDYGPLEVGDAQTLDVWGVVTGVIRQLS